uniref:Piezo non-specific cation channel R-Ras-binding domain-containing protein n=1 Tax=Compsopogon caeruleus TaxID=31354 RepID=A0A7S1XFN2_9RHOD|mmetsp:Transcript_3568/g.6765  ORF Transcript_3568/g.6765 Transcript_3568/m.6765 type:complete len:2319 (+) Transcript_3568:2-6958(+)
MELGEVEVEAPIPTRMSFFLAGRGGILWVASSLAVSASFHSGILQLLLLIVLLSGLVVWAFQLKNFWPDRSPRFIILICNFVRIITAVTIALIYISNCSFTNGAFRQPWAQLLGAVSLDLGAESSWASILGFSACIIFYQVSGMYEFSVRSVFGDYGAAAEGIAFGVKCRVSIMSFFTMKASLFLGALGFLCWAMVFPGILTAPLLVYSMTLLALAPRSRMFLSRLVAFYAIGIHLTFFLCGAILTSFSVDSAVDFQLLGLRQLTPQFAGNWLQAVAISLLCISVHFDLLMPSVDVVSDSQSTTVTPGVSLWGILQQFSTSNFCQNVLEPFRLFLDQLAMTFLMLAGVSRASLLDLIFVIQFGILALTEGILTSIGRSMNSVFDIRRKTSLILWWTCLIYAILYMSMVLFFCRLRDDICTNAFAGFSPVGTFSTLYVCILLVLSSIQVHFNWSEGLRLIEFDTKQFGNICWRLLLRGHRYLVYGLLLIIPLLFPANFLFYGGIVLLMSCFVLEIGSLSFGRLTFLLNRAMNAGNVTLVVILIVRYLARMPQIQQQFSRRSLMITFGFFRGAEEYDISLGDGFLVMFVSLQCFLMAVHDRFKEILTNSGVLEGSSRNQLFPTSTNVQSIVARTVAGLGGFVGIILRNLQDLLFSFSFAITAYMILVASIWLNGVSVFGGIYALLGCLTVFLDSTVHIVRQPDGTIVPEFPRSMNVIPLCLLLLSFGLLTFQYLYLVLVSTGSPWSEVARYLGLFINENGDEVPLHNSAIIGHVIVAVGAFLERSTTRWSIALRRDQKFDVLSTRGLRGSQERWAGVERNTEGAEGAHDMILAHSTMRETNAQNLPWRNDIESQMELSGEEDPGKSKFVHFFANENNAPKDTTAIETKVPHSVESGNVGAHDNNNCKEINELSGNHTIPENALVEVPLEILKTNPKAYRDAQSSREVLVPDFIDIPPESDLSESDANENVGNATIALLRHPLTPAWLDETDRELVQKGMEVASFFWSGPLSLVTAAGSYVIKFLRLFLPFFSICGIEATFLIIVSGACFSNSIFSTLHLVLLVPMFSLPRARRIRYWVVWTFILIISFIVQYLMALNLPTSESGAPTESLTYFYLDAGNQSPQRKWDLTVAFLAVLFAGITLNHLPSVKFDVVRENLPEGRLSALLPQTNHESDSVSSEEDFTRSPLSFQDAVLLFSMRSFSGFTQAFMMITSTINTTVFSGILLISSFVGFYYFKDLLASKTTFRILRFYLILVICAKVIYQAPGISPAPWSDILGLSDQYPTILPFLLILWLLCQIQSRMYESSKFKYVVEYVQADESYRYRRAAHHHLSTRFHLMLHFNKSDRDRSRRERRIERITELLETGHSLSDAMWDTFARSAPGMLEEEISAEDYLVEKLQAAKEKASQLPWWNRAIRRMAHGRTWVAHIHFTLIHEIYAIFSNHSAWFVYLAIVLAAMFSPSVLNLVNPIVMILYLIVEQPRPPPSIWATLILYNMLVTLFKFVARSSYFARCQTPYFEYPFDETYPYSPNVRKFDICTLGAGVGFNVIILITLIWHRMNTYYRGLWELRTADEDLRVESQVHGEKILRNSSTQHTLSGENFRLGRTNQLELCEQLIFQTCRDGRADSVPWKSESRPSKYSSEASGSRYQPTFGEFHRHREDILAGALTPGPTPFVPHSVRPSQRMRSSPALGGSEQTPDEATPSVGAGNGPKRLIQEGFGGANAFLRPIAAHYRKLLKPNPFEATRDFYLLMFTVDFAGFLFMIFAWPYMFLEPNALKQTPTWWNSNFIPVGHLWTLIAMFLGMVLDRVFYLRKSMIGKVLLHHSSALVYHYVLFYITNIGTKSSVKVFYLIKCLYFFVSGAQIKRGFPTYKVGQTLMRNFSMIAFLIFIGWYSIPFLFLLRTLLDWGCNPTALELVQYFKLMDIYTWLYINRSVNFFRSRFRRVLGQKRPFIPRFFQGFGVFALLSLLLFLPFLLYSALNPFFESRVLTQSSFESSIVVSDSVHPIYSRTTLGVKTPTLVQLEEFARRYNVTPQGSEKSEFFKVSFEGNSAISYVPSLPDQETLSASLNRSTTARIRFSLISLDGHTTVRADRDYPMSERAATTIAEAIADQKDSAVLLEVTLPRYLQVSSRSATFEDAGLGNRTMCLRFFHVLNPSDTRWWSLSDCVESNCTCTQSSYSSALVGTVDYLLQVSFVSSISIGGGTIIAVFAVILFTVGNFAKNFFANKRLLIPYTDMAYTLHLYQIVLDIFHSRLEGDLATEEVLFWGLTEIYRNEHLLAKFSGRRRVLPKEQWWGRDRNVFAPFSETRTEQYLRRHLE